MLAAIILLPFLYGIALACCGCKLSPRAGLFVLPVPIVLFLYFVWQIPRVAAGAGAAFSCPLLPQLGIDFALGLNGVSLIFALLISGIGALICCYSIGYLKPQENLTAYYCLILFFLGAMLGVVVARNLMVLYLFWEWTSVTSFLLIGFWHDRSRARYGAQKALFLTVCGGFCLFAAFVLLYTVAGSLDIDTLLQRKELILHSPAYIPILILTVLGAFTKSAQIPFHIWLPDAMEAPTPISCFLHSATMVKAGIYLLLIMTPLLGGNALWFAAVSGVGLLSLIWGAYQALKQTDLKAILAYSTVSQLGLIVALIGFGSQASLTAALFHTVNHATFKGSLFLVAGMIDHSCGTRDVRRLGGLAKVMPRTAVLAACGCLAMAGLPPFNGFLSKELFFGSALEAVSGNLAFLGGAAWLIPALAVLGSIFTFAYCLLILFRVFAGPLPAALPQTPHEAPRIMLWPSAILASFTLIIAFFPNLLARYLLTPAISGLLGETVRIHIAFWHGFNLSLLMTLLVFALGFALYKAWPQARKLFFGLPKLCSANAVYDRLIPGNGLIAAAGKVTDLYMTRRLQDYIVFNLLFFLCMTLGSIFCHVHGLRLLPEISPVSPFAYAWAACIIAAAIAVVRSQNRIPAVLSLGAIGYSVSFFFAVFCAPDLALTQLLIETVSLALFFLAFRHLPASFADKPQSRRRKRFNLLIALLTGCCVSLVALIGQSNRMFSGISGYYVENAKALTGGSNIVNVILVDFRGLDTMGEISVIAVAAIGVFVLIGLSPVKPFNRQGGDRQ
ncbi:MAG: DUF4040 domain-containing protein [Firmicutes bacterium]|nr:DUF4040 domain-containing protein [Bacillota bacterium]